MTELEGAVGGGHGPLQPPLASIYFFQKYAFQLLVFFFKEKHNLDLVFKLWPLKKILLQSGPPKINFLVPSLLTEWVKL
jgi:hypothetical protein